MLAWRRLAPACPYAPATRAGSFDVYVVLADGVASTGTHEVMFTYKP